MNTSEVCPIRVGSSVTETCDGARILLVREYRSITAPGRLPAPAHGTRQRPGSSFMQPSTPLVFVVDDDASVRESLALLIDSAGWRSQTFASAEAFLSCDPAPGAPACVVLDVRLPDLDGVALQGRLSHGRPGLPVIFISGHGDVPTTVRAMKGGAIDFLVKPFDAGALLGAIEHALEGSRATLARGAQLGQLRERYASLTPRECEVMTAVVSGRLNKQVGGDLGITESTVKAHRGQVVRKMKADSLPELVRMAARLGLPHAPTHSSIVIDSGGIEAWYERPVPRCSQ